MRKSSLALLALSASLVAGEAYGVPPGWLAKAKYRGLLGNPSGTVASVEQPFLVHPAFQYLRRSPRP